MNEPVAAASASVSALVPETSSEAPVTNDFTEGPVTTVNLNDMLSDGVNLRIDYDGEYVI